jgi:D-alanine-D-alanine ligase
LTQVEAIENALAELQYPSARIVFTRDAGAVLQNIAQEKAQLVINLCESVDEDPQYIGHPAAMLELLGVPFSGSPSLALMLTTDKLLSKRLLASSGIKSPGFAVYEGAGMPDVSGLQFPLIAKPRFQDASIGIDQSSVFREKSELLGKVEDLYQQFGPLLIEEYISGREFNISLFGFPRPEALPIAEISFEGFPPELFRILGYRAKWDINSFEYRHSPRIFPYLAPELNEKLAAMSLDCFRLFMLRDYARVDVRVDAEGEIYVLEVNANPCLSPDAGFAAAVAQSSLSYVDMIERFLRFMRERANR